MKLLVFDTETTGLIHHPLAELSVQPRIIEFAAVLIDSGLEAPVDELSILINPLIPITAEITGITGITDKMVADAPAFPEVAARLSDFFGAADVMVAHNFQFDETMLRNELRRHALLEGFRWPPRGVCTVQLFAEEFGYNPKLTELYAAKMGRPLAQTHRAMDDVRALADIVTKERLWEIFPN